MKTKTTKFSQGVLIYNRDKDAKEFFCDRCKKSKKSKITVRWETNDNETKTICNGCYGRLLSMEQK